MVDLGVYVFKDLNTGGIKPEESFTGAYIKEVHGSAHVCASTKRLPVILDAKYEKSDLHKVVKTQCQYLKLTQCNDLLKVLHKFE